MVKKIFAGFHAITGEKVYLIDLGMMQDYQTALGKKVDAKDIVVKLPKEEEPVVEAAPQPKIAKDPLPYDYDEGEFK